MVPKGWLAKPRPKVLYDPEVVEYVRKQRAMMPEEHEEHTMSKEIAPGTKLYKKDSMGRIRVWWQEVCPIEESDGSWSTGVKSTSGLAEGTLKETTTATKSTATMTPREVAESKIKTSYDKKLKSGYFDNQEDAKSYKPNKLMLLHKWDTDSHKINYPCLAMPKLDGVCAGYMDTDDPHFKSRDNNRFEKLDAMAVTIKDYLDAVNGTPRKRLDSHGELYAHGRPVSEIVEAIKGDNKEVLAELQFCIFDYMDDRCEDRPYTGRLKLGHSVYRWDNGDKCPFVPIRIRVAHNETEVREIYDVFIAHGFEGAVVCNTNGYYQYEKRTYDKLKYKQLFSDEFEITKVDYEDNNGKKLIMFACKTDKGVGFKVRPKWSHDKRAGIYEEYVSGDTKFPGQMATVEYRSVTKYGTPFHPVMIEVRNYE